MGLPAVIEVEQAVTITLYNPFHVAFLSVSTSLSQLISSVQIPQLNTYILYTPIEKDAHTNGNSLESGWAGLALGTEPRQRYR